VVADSEKVWGEDYLTCLKELYPEGHLEGSHYRVSSTGDYGRRMVFNTETGRWTDFGDDDNKGEGLCSFVAMMEGWEGIQRLTKADFCNLDVPLYLVHDQARLGSVFDYAEKKSMEVTRRWEYRDSDGVLLGVRVRLEDKISREKEFVTLTYRSGCSKEVRGKRISRSEGWTIYGGWGTLCPFYGEELLIKDGDKPILICEGEKATDAARQLLGEKFRCITWGGGSTKMVLRSSWGELKENKEVYLWPDKDIPGKKSAEKLAEKMRFMKVLPVFEEDRLGESDDAADVLTKSKVDQEDIVSRLIRNAERTIGKQQAGTTDRYIYVISRDMFWDKITATLKNSQQINRAHQYETEKFSEELLDDPQFIRVEDIVFQPGRDEIVLEKMNGHEVSCLNSWRPNDLQPELGEPTGFLAHMEYLIPDERIREKILDYMAFYIQRPGEKTHSAIVLQGAQGTGKSYILEVLKRVLGSNVVREITTDSLKRDFNAWVEGAQLLAVEEIMAGGRIEITNKLKPLITSPTVEINHKKVDTYMIPNKANLIFFTNHENALHLDEGDRRFFVYFSPVRPRTEPGYYNQLFDELDEISGKILNFLQKRDISSFNPKAPAMMTDNKKSIIQRSRPALEIEIEERMAERRAPFDQDVVAISDVVEWARSARLISPFQGSPAISTIMVKTGAQALPDVKIGAEIRKLYAVRNYERYLKLTPEERRKLIKDVSVPLEKKSNSSVDPEQDGKSC